MAKNKNLHAAKAAKNDEFYTQLTDIEKELKYYKDQFKDQIVYCNCDNPTKSEFCNFFRLKFVDWGIKKLIVTCLTEDKSTGLVYTWDRDTNGNGILDDEEVKTIPLKQDGDFRSDECLEYLKEADIIVTNPPFSLFREYMKQLMDNEKKFLIIGNQNAVTYKEIFPYIKNGELWMGYSMNGSNRWFQAPDDYKVQNNASGYKEVDGKKYFFVNGVAWFTNLKTNKSETPDILVKTYNAKDYPTYDNYNAIECSKIVNLPKDLSIGTVVGVPITIVYKIADDGYIYFSDGTDIQKWEILGSTQRTCHDNFLDTKKYNDYKETRQDGTLTGNSGNKTNENANLKGKPLKGNYFKNSNGDCVYSLYSRIFIKRIQ